MGGAATTKQYWAQPQPGLVAVAAARNKSKQDLQIALAAAKTAKSEAAKQALAAKSEAAKHALAAKSEAAKQALAAKNEAAKQALAAKSEESALQRAAKNEAAKQALGAKNEAARRAKALRDAVVTARIQLNIAGGELTSEDRKAYATSLQAYRNAKLYTSKNNGNLGVLKYNSTGKLRAFLPATRTGGTHGEFIANMRKKLGANPRNKKELLDRAIANLSTRLSTISNNRRALDMINNYRPLSTNANYVLNLNRRTERRKPEKKKNEEKSKNKGQYGSGGQQIIFGQPGPMAAAAAQPIMMAGQAGPTISVNPTIRVNVPPAAAQAAMQTLPPSERSALNNAGGYRRAASLISNAGGPANVSQAISALGNSNGNVQKAMERSGLPRQVFNNVNKLGGPVTARRTLTAVKKVSQKTRKVSVVVRGRARKATTSTVVRGRARKATTSTVVRGRARKATTSTVVRGRARKAVKKYVSSACVKPLHANTIKTIVHQLSRKNLEKNFVICLLR